LKKNMSWRGAGRPLGGADKPPLNLVPVTLIVPADSVACCAGDR